MNLTNYERFYTNSLKDANLVDQIEIDTLNKNYRLLIDELDCIVDGEDENGEDIISFPVSRFIFDAIINGVKTSGFTKID